MASLLEILDDNIHIGIIEDYFEQYNSKKYPSKSVVELQKTENKTLLDALSTMLRLSVDAADLGEARDGEALFVFLQLAQAIGKSTFFTTHMATPEDYVPRAKNMLIASGKYSTERAAVFDLVQYTNLIFQHGMVDGKRCITSIVEIVPLIEKSATRNIHNLSTEDLQRLSYIHQIQESPSYMYRLNQLIQLENGKMVFKNFPTSNMINRAKKDIRSYEYMKSLIKLMEEDLGTFKGEE